MVELACCLSLVTEYSANIQLVQFTRERLQGRKCAAGIAIWIGQRAAITLSETLHGVAQPFEFIEGCLKFRVCHLVFLTIQ